MLVRVRTELGESLLGGLTPGKTYPVVGIEADEYRLVNDKKDPVLYPPDLFEVLDEQEPHCWIHSVGSEGERYAYPPELNTPGFFEDYHDGVHTAVSEFRRYMESLGG
ncbi:MAG: hypothetical protein ACLFUJ_09070 [Phycisphaerae bacterium]